MVVYYIILYHCYHCLVFSDCDRSTLTLESCIFVPVLYCFVRFVICKGIKEDKFHGFQNNLNLVFVQCV